MKRTGILLILIGFFLFFLPVIDYRISNVFCAQVVSGTELINNAFKYDTKEVSYSGEAIGDVMPRGKFCWVNIYDGAVAIGVWVDAASAGGILYTGSHRSKGDIVEVAGVFNRACREHGGDLDIHADVLKVAVPGRSTVEQLDSVKKNTAVIFLGILCIIWISSLLRRR